jgi:hypothetical protein
MGSALMAAARAHAASAYVEPSAETVSGTYQGRISTIRTDGVYVVLPDFHSEREFGPCVIPVGVQGVGPATYHAGTPPTVTLANGVDLAQGYLVLVYVPSRGNPWLTHIAPTGPGV